MFILSAIITLFLLIVIIIFSFPQFSPIPYFPSNKNDLHLILKALDLKNNQTVIDLGAGDGVIVFEGAKEALRKKLNTLFIAVELNPILILILHIRRLLHPNKKNIKIVRADMFKMDYSKLFTFNFSLLTVYLYISPWFLKQISEKIKKELPKAKIVSYFYPIKNLKLNKELKGKNKLYIYNNDYKIM